MAVVYDFEIARKRRGLEYTVHYNGPEGLIVQPHSRLAAAKWAEDTDWPSANQTSGAFNATPQPLYIFLPHGSSLQTWFQRTVRHEPEKFYSHPGLATISDEAHASGGVARSLLRLVIAADKLDPGLGQLLMQHTAIPLKQIPKAERSITLCTGALIRARQNFMLHETAKYIPPAIEQNDDFKRSCFVHGIGTLTPALDQRQSQSFWNRPRIL